MLVLWLKAFHIFAVMAWMAGMFYLPRLFVYHAEAKPGSETARTLAVMEERLLRIIMNPAMAAVWISGPLLAWMTSMYTDYWFMAKVALVIVMSGFHGELAKWHKQLAAGTNIRPARFYRIANEFPTVLAALIIILVVVKPF